MQIMYATILVLPYAMTIYMLDRMACFHSLTYVLPYRFVESSIFLHVIQ